MAWTDSLNPASAFSLTAINYQRRAVGDVCI